MLVSLANALKTAKPLAFFSHVSLYNPDPLRSQKDLPVKDINTISARIPSLSGLIVFVAIGLLIIVSVMSSWYTIDEKERGVVLRNGAFVSVAEPGLGFKVPWIDSVKIISVQNQTTTYKNVQAYSRDQQTASMSISVSLACLAR